MRLSFKQMCNVTHKLFIWTTCNEIAFVNCAMSLTNCWSYDIVLGVPFRNMCIATHHLSVIGQDVMKMYLEKCALLSLTLYLSQHIIYETIAFQKMSKVTHFLLANRKRCFKTASQKYLHHPHILLVIGRM
jgi:hypothetical protein